MSMKLRKNLGRIATAFVATAMLASVAAVPASADPIAEKTVTFTQTLDMSEAEGAGVPDVSISYTVSNTGFTIPEGSMVEAGPSGTITVSEVTFDDDSEYDENTKTYSEMATVTFGSDVTFQKPGIYRYMITRDDSASTSVTASDNDVRYLDVYVGWKGYDDDTAGAIPEDADLVIYDYVLISNPSLVPDADGNYEGGTSVKSAGYSNAYATTSLQLTKQVTGAMGNKSEKFSFDITLTDCETSTVSVSINGAKAVSYEADKEIPLTDAIQNGQSIVITGLPVGTEYAIEETDASAYKTTWAGDSITTENASENDTKTVNGAIENGENLVTVTNTKAAVSPTGIVMNVAPYALLVVVAAGACFVFLRKRRED